MQTSLCTLKICHNLMQAQSPSPSAHSPFLYTLLCIFQSQVQLPLSLFLLCSFFRLDQIPQNMQVFPLFSKLYMDCKAYRHGQGDSLPFSALCQLVTKALKGQGPMWAASHSKLACVAFLSSYFLCQMMSFFMSDAVKTVSLQLQFVSCRSNTEGNV